ncbi:helix-turn-helix domain-containing protein [Yinghuangia sp. YIM S10712]|uniref:helix-turn-helix domain-containing protein n=1 Tax=Yinghuangia sp. YIM S10712 TaxID=3436930 RepID=UPI003F530188
MTRAKTGVKREPLVSAQEVADFLDIPLQTIYTWRHRGKGPKFTMVGRHLKTKWSIVDAWLEAQDDAA